MAQAVPSNIAYAQAIELIDKLRKQYAANKFQTPDEVAVIIKELIARFDTGVGFALTEFEPLQRGEPPHSEVINRFYGNIKSDVNILQDQVDLNRAAVAFTHNFQKTEIMKAQLANSRLQNKIKTLEMYSQTSDSTLVKLGDAFLNDEFVDWSLTDASERATFISPGNVGLSTTEQTNNLLAKAKIRILNTSNGFLGNNQEAAEVTNATNPVTNEKTIRFVAEDNRAADLAAVLDAEPNTWIEYEYYKVSDSDRASAQNLNFVYKAAANENLVGVEVTSSGLVDWGKGPSNGKLQLEVEVDLQQAELINVVKFTPFGLPDNRNNPIKIVSASISETGTDWDTLNPQGLWIVNAIDKQISIAGSENVTVGSATWVTNGTYTRYIRFKIEQPTPINVNIGHIYYVKDVSPNATGNNAVTSSSVTTAQQRVLGPIPPLNEPGYYNDPRNTGTSSVIQKRELFRGQRWAIGIRDIDVTANSYKAFSVLVTKQFNIPGLIDRVALDADIQIPPTFSQAEAWIKFFISPNEGTNWYQISRIQDDYLDIPEILAFNDPTPGPLREPGISYIDIPNLKVSSLRLKIEFSRPVDEREATPVLKSYTLEIKRRS